MSKTCGTIPLATRRDIGPAFGHRRRRTGLLALQAMFLLTALLGESAAADRKEVPLTSIALVADLDAPIDKVDPGTGGSFETGAYFQTRLADARSIQTCMDPIEHAASDWATGLGLVRSLRDRTGESLTLHYAKTGLAGFFAVTYRVELQVKARVRVDFIILDGTQRSPELARDMLGTYRIAALQDAFDKAIKCNGRAT